MDQAIIAHYQAEFERLRPALPGDVAVREKALARFAAQGFPTRHEEAWKYTDLRELAKATPTVDPVPADAGLPAGILDWPSLRIGLFNGELTVDSDLPEGLSIKALADVQAVLSTDETEPLRALNAAFVQHGVVIDVADEAQIDVPLHLRCHQTGADGVLRNVRIVIRLGRNARCMLLEQYSASDDATHFLNAITDVQLAEGAYLHRVLLQQDASAAWHVHATRLQQSASSQSHLVNIDLGARLSRHDTEVSLNEAGAEVHLHGLYFPDGERHIDNHTVIDHRAPGCVSRETYHGLLNDRGRGVFNGRIVVHRDAQKTDSEQSSRAILLSRHAEVDAKPELEIYADDVKCAHGATVGQLDDKALFYLMSRGISRDTARALLVCSFAGEITAAIQDEKLRRHVLSEIVQRLPGGLSADEVLA